MELQYADLLFSISKVAQEIGFSESKLSHLINGKYPGGFRSLVHELRITEGKRLLKEADINVSEIAYKLGYVTHNLSTANLKKGLARHQPNLEEQFSVLYSELLRLGGNSPRPFLNILNTLNCQLIFLKK